VVGEDRWPIDRARPLSLAAYGREPSDTPAVWEHGAQNRGAAGAGRIEGDGGQANRLKEDGEGQVYEKPLDHGAPSVSPVSGGGRTGPFLGRRSRPGWKG
jgi:hypothetical protein